MTIVLIKNRKMACFLCTASENVVMVDMRIGWTDPNDTLTIPTNTMMLIRRFWSTNRLISSTFPKKVLINRHLDDSPHPQWCSLAVKTRVLTKTPHSVYCFSVVVLYIDLRPGQTCHSKVMHRKEVTHSDGSYEKKSRRRAWLTKWDKVKIPWYTHGVSSWCNG